jgi:hypothetical protein
MGALGMVTDPTFKETIRRLWQQKPSARQLPEREPFTLYREAVRRRLAPHQFARPLLLRENPRHQTQWTDWLEYLGYEKWWLEELTALAEPLEDQYRQAWRRMLRAPRRSSREARASCQTEVSSTSAALGFMNKKGQQRPARIVDMAKELEAARASLDATDKTLDNFIRETEPYLNAQTAVYYQRHRVEWVIKVASLMDMETAQQSTRVKNKAGVDTRENRKRQHGNDTTPGTRFKRVRRGRDGERIAPDATLGKPRRSARLAQSKSLQSSV